MLLFAFLRASRSVPSFFRRAWQWCWGSGDERRNRSRAIDVLRAVAILLVLGCHYVVNPGAAGALSPLAEAWYRVGWAGVDLFFVLSGYLVSGLLFAEYRRTGAIDVRRFLVRRSLKIWPAYFAYLAFLALWFSWQRAHGKPVEIFDSLRANLLHLQNYLGTPREHTWSLAVEEHFYLGLALLGLLTLRSVWLRERARQFAAPAFVLALVGLAAWRQGQFAAHGREALNLYATHLRFDGLLVGTALAYLQHFRPAALAWSTRRPLVTVLVGALLALPWMVATPDSNAWAAGAGLSAMYLGFALVVVGCVQFERTTVGARVFQSRPAGALATVGFFSYGVYLWHIDFAQTPLKKIVALLPATSLPPEAIWMATTLAYVGLALAFGALMSRLVELPALALRERYFGTDQSRPSRPRVVTTPAPAIAAS